jgi:hypothetical protein
MSDPSMKVGRTWHEIATEMLAEQNSQRMTRLTEELDSALERDSANRVHSHQPHPGSAMKRHLTQGCAADRLISY